MNNQDQFISETDYAHAIESADLALWRYDPSRHQIAGDSRMQKLFALPSSSIPVPLWMERIHNEDLENLKSKFDAENISDSLDIEYRVLLGGETRWIRTRARAISDEGHTVLLGVCEDTTKRKAEAALAQSVAECLNMAQAAGKIAAWRWNYLTGEIAWYGSSEWIYGRPEQEVDSIDKCFEFVYPEDRARLQKVVTEGLAERCYFQAETRLIWPDGSVHWMAMSARGVISDDCTQILQIVGTNVDISERKITESNLLLSEKLATVERLASSISHEINNPLEAVTNLIFLSRSAPGIPAEVQHYLELADLELRRVSAISNQTLRFYRQSTRRAMCRPAALLSAAALLYQARIQNCLIHIEERHRPASELHCLDGEIRQVLNHLVANAIDAMPFGGRLFLRTRNATEWCTGRSGICFTIADDGSGMPRDIQRRVFEAFFTTKGIGGIGLGLWLSREIVDRHRGTCRFRSSIGRGSVFIIFLPMPTLGA